MTSTITSVVDVSALETVAVRLNIFCIFIEQFLARAMVAQRFINSIELACRVGFSY